NKANPHWVGLRSCHEWPSGSSSRKRDELASPHCRPPAALFNQRVGSLQKRFWKCEAYGLRGFESDGEIEVRGLLNRYVFRLLALQNSLHEPCAMPKRRWPIRSKGHQAAYFRKHARGRGRRHTIFERHICDRFDRQTALDDNGIGALFHHR